MKKYNTILIALFTVTILALIASFATKDIFWTVLLLLTAISTLIFLFFGERWCVREPKYKVVFVNEEEITVGEEEAKAILEALRKWGKSSHAISIMWASLADSEDNLLFAIPVHEILYVKKIS